MTQATKERFLSILQRELSKHEWAKDAERLKRAMEYAAKTLDGHKTCVIDSESWKTAWKEIGMKGKPTYKGLHALPAMEAV
jgi:hypothetical protein